MTFLNREVAIVGESQSGKTYLNNLFLKAAYKQYDCYEKRPLVINPYKKEDYHGVSFSYALTRGSIGWSSALKKRVEDRIVTVEDLNLIKGRSSHWRMESMFLRRRFDLVTISQNLVALRNVLSNIKLFAFFKLENQSLISEAVRSKAAVGLQERIRSLKLRRYLIVDNQTKHASRESFSNENVDPLVDAFQNGIQDSGEFYASLESVRKKQVRHPLAGDVLEMKLKGMRNVDIAAHLGRTQNEVCVAVFVLKEKGLLPNVDARLKSTTLTN